MKFMTVALSLMLLARRALFSSSSCLMRSKDRRSSVQPGFVGALRSRSSAFCFLVPQARLFLLGSGSHLLSAGLSLR